MKYRKHTKRCTHMKAKLLYTFLLFFIVGKTHAQQSALEQYHQLIASGRNCAMNDFKKATIFYQNAAEIAKKNHFYKEEGNALIALSYCYQAANDSLLEINTLQNAAQIFDKTGDFNNFLQVKSLIANFYYYDDQLDAGDKIVSQYIAEAAARGAKEGEGHLYSVLANGLISKKKNDSCIYCANRAISLLENTNNDKALGRTYNYLGVGYYYKNNMYKALLCYQKAKEYYKKCEFYRGVMITSLNIANIYAKIKDFDSAEKEYLALREHSQEIQYQDGIFFCNNSLASMYIEKEDYTKAFGIFENLENKAKTDLKGDDYVLFLVNHLSSAVFTKHFTKADNLYLALENVMKTYQSELQLQDAYLAIGEYLLAKNDCVRAYTAIKKGLKIAIKDESDKDTKWGYFMLTSACHKLEKQREAETAFQQYVALENKEKQDDNVAKIQFYRNQQAEDSTQAAMNREISLLQVKADSGKKQQQLWLFLIGSLLVSALGYAFSLYRRNQEKNKNNALLEAANLQNETLLRNILPEEIANELKATGKTEAKEFESTTVLFVDIQNFTAKSALMSATELVAELDYCFRAFDEIIAKYPVEKIKTVGDAYICVGGLPKTNTSHPYDLIFVAIEIQQFMQSYKEKRLAENKIHFEIRIGINTGNVVAGVVGTKKFAYDIWGDTVNVAARLQETCEVGKINISAETQQHIATFFNCVPRGFIPVKNHGEVDMFYVEY